MAVQLLKKIPYLRHLPDAALRRLSKIAKTHSFRKGEMVISQKDAADHLFIVAEGKIKIFVSSNTRKQKTFAVISKGEFFGELALLDGTVRTASALALEPSTLIMIPKYDFQKFLMKDSAFVMLLLRTMAERLRKTNETIEALLFKNILGRVAKVLVDLHDKTPNGRDAGIVVTHQELAGWVGTSREPLSRALGSLRRGGYLQTEQGRVRITDVEKLRQLCAS